jgi:hypothetical protein
MKPLAIFGVAFLMWSLAGCAPTASPQPAQPSQGTAHNEVGQSGRYQLVFDPHTGTNTYLVDTQKGRVWLLTKFTDMYTQPTAFNEVDVIDQDGQTGKTWEVFFETYKIMEEKARAPAQ